MCEGRDVWFIILNTLRLNHGVQVRLSYHRLPFDICLKLDCALLEPRMRSSILLAVISTNAKYFEGARYGNRRF